MLVPTDSHAAIFSEVMSGADDCGRLVARRRNGRANVRARYSAHLSRDTDFARFPFMEIVDPMVDEP